MIRCGKCHAGLFNDLPMGNRCTETGAEHPITPHAAIMQALLSYIPTSEHWRYYSVLQPVSEDMEKLVLSMTDDYYKDE